MTMFMNKDEPNFIWNNGNALLDYGLIIENEISEVVTMENLEEIAVPGRSHFLTSWDGDFLPYDLKIPNISFPYENYEEVVRWLRGQGKLITHNDEDKYREARVSFSKPIELENQWGFFYNFDLVFRCQPFKRKVNESTIELKRGINDVFDHGMENSQPSFEIENNGGTIEIITNGNVFKILDAPEGILKVDSRFSKVIQHEMFLKSIGEWPFLAPDWNKIQINGNYSKATMKKGSVWR